MTPLDWVLLVGTIIGFIGATRSVYLAYFRTGEWKNSVPITSPTLSAGPELDRRIAEDFMGLIPCDQWEGPYPQEGGLIWNHTGPTDHRCYRQDDPPPYSRLWGQAWAVLEELQRGGRVVVITLDGHRRPPKYTVMIDHFHPVEADTVIHALAYAALNTIQRTRRPVEEGSCCIGFDSRKLLEMQETSRRA
ncbi:hypothetical protein [Nitrospira sp. Nam74]